MGDTSRFSNRCPFKGGIKGYVRVVAIAESLLDDLTAFMCAPEHQDIKVDIEERFAKDIVSMVPCEVSRIYVSANQVRIVPLLNEWAHRSGRTAGRLPVPKGCCHGRAYLSTTVSRVAFIWQQTLLQAQFAPKRPPIKQASSETAHRPKERQHLCATRH